MTSETKRILRLEQVKGLTGLSRSTIYDYVSKKNFPQPVKLGTHSVGWIESEVQDWINLLVESRDSGVKVF